MLSFPAMAKTRLDVLMVERGLAESRALAQRLVMAGQVRVNGQVALKPATPILPDVNPPWPAVRIRSRGQL